jgi:hypothetical protein
MNAEPPIGSRWTILHAKKPQPVEFKVVSKFPTTCGHWYILEVVSDNREDPHAVGFRFNVEDSWFVGRGRRIDPT